MSYWGFQQPLNDCRKRNRNFCHKHQCGWITATTYPRGNFVLFCFVCLTSCLFRFLLLPVSVGYRYTAQSFCEPFCSGKWSVWRGHLWACVCVHACTAPPHKCTFTCFWHNSPRISLNKSQPLPPLQPKCWGIMGSKQGCPEIHDTRLHLNFRWTMHFFFFFAYNCLPNIAWETSYTKNNSIF